MSQMAGEGVAITGGASGIGAEVAAARGARVAILDINMDQARAVADRFDGRAFHLDVQDERSVIDTIERVEREMGPLHGGITSAGIVQTPMPPDENDMDVFDRIHQVNFRGTFLSLREMARHMLPRRQGSLVALNENSTLGRMVEPSEIGTVAAFLLSDDASAVTGVSMAVDAGFYHAGSWAPYGGIREH